MITVVSIHPDIPLHSNRDTRPPSILISKFELLNVRDLFGRVKQI